MKKLLSVFLVLGVMVTFTGCFGLNDKDKKPSEEESNSTTSNDEQAKVNQLEPPKSGDTVATIKTNFGEMKFRLLEKAAPKAVENFIGLAKKDYYDGLIFHRVINDFMIQGGDPTGTGMGGESIFGEPFKDEFNDTVKHYYGALSMANSGPDTNGSQFFIVESETVDEDYVGQMKSANFPEEIVNRYIEKGGTPWLDSRHTVFGQMYEGFSVLKEIASTKVDDNEKPIENVVIKDIIIEDVK